MIEICISGGAAAGRVTAGQTIIAALAGSVTFPDRATSWAGDVWVIRCEGDADTVGALVGAVPVDGFTVTIGGAAAAVDDAPPVDALFTWAPEPPPAKVKKVNRRATPG